MSHCRPSLADLPRPLFLLAFSFSCAGPAAHEPIPAPAPASKVVAGAPEATPSSPTEATSEPAVAAEPVADADSAAKTETAAAPEPPRDPEAAAALLEQGRALQQQRGEGGAADAIALYEQAIAKDPACAPCYWELGWSRQVQADWDGCVTAWDRVREIDPDYPELDVHFPVALMRRQQAATLAALPDPGAVPSPDLEPYAGPTITLRAVGDVHMGRAWPENRVHLPPNDARDLLSGFRDELQAADFTFGNLETTLADSGPSTKCGPKSTKCFAFRVPTAFAGALRDAGFDVMSIANNHAGDFGDAGRQSTMSALNGVGIRHSGPVGDIASWETKGLQIGLVAFSTGGGVYRLQDIEMARKVVADLDRTHDLVVVYFHGGAEGSAAAHVPAGTEMFLGENRGDLRAFAHALIDTGADLVLGSGPHRLRGMEIYRGRLVAYSLGNFSSWETFSLTGPLGITGILEVQLAANGVLLAARLLPGVIEKPGRPHPDPQGRAIEIVRDLSREDFGAPVLNEKGIWTRPTEPAS